MGQNGELDKKTVLLPCRQTNEVLTNTLVARMYGGPTHPSPVSRPLSLFKLRHKSAATVHPLPDVAIYYRWIRVPRYH